MRQVTGSNPTTSNKKVSIQLRLGGHSFSRDVLNKKVAEDAIVEVELLTPKSIIAPTECFDPNLAANLMQISGIALAESEQVVWSDDQDGVTALVALDGEIVDELKQTYGERLHFTSPLLRSVASEGRYLYIYNMGGFAYLKLCNGSAIEFCEALPLASADDVLYSVEALVREFGVESFEIYVAGEEREELINTLKQYYKVRKCE